MVTTNESYRTTKGDGARAEILYMRTFDGEPAWRFYPVWQRYNSDAFKSYSSRYMHGVDGSEQDCAAELKSVLDGLAEKLLEEGTKNAAWIAEKCYLLRDAFRPISIMSESFDRTTFLEKTKDRRYIAYGIYGALTVGYQVDFAALIADVCKLRDGILAGGEKRAESVLALDRLILDARCMNDVGDILAWLGQVSAVIVNSMRAILLPNEMKTELPKHVQTFCESFEKRCQPSKLLYVRHILSEAYKELIEKEGSRVKQYVLGVRGHVETLLEKRWAGEICRRRDDEGLKKAIFEDTVDVFVRFVNGVKCKENKEILFKRMNAVADDVYKYVEKVLVKGVVESKEIKKLAAAYEKKGKIPAGWTGSFMRQLADEYRAVTLLKMQSDK